MFFVIRASIQRGEIAPVDPPLRIFGVCSVPPTRSSSLTKYIPIDDNSTLPPFPFLCPNGRFREPFILYSTPRSHSDTSIDWREPPRYRLSRATILLLFR